MGLKADDLTRLSVRDYPYFDYYITSGLNRKCVGGCQNGHQNWLLRHRFTLEYLKIIREYLKVFRFGKFY